MIQHINNHAIREKRRKIHTETDLREKLILLLFFLGFLTMNIFSPLEVISKFIIIFCVLYLVKSKYFTILIIPFIMMSNVFETIPGTSIMFCWVYFITLFIRSLYQKKIFINRSYLLPLLLYVFYEMKVMPISYSRMISDLGFLLAIIIINTEVSNNKDIIKKFLIFISFFSFLAGIIPIIQGFEYTKQALGFIRMGSLGMGDPNYSSIVYNLGIFSLLGIKANNNLKLLRIIIILALYYFLISTLSVAGIIINVIGILLYILLVKKISKKFKVLIVGVIVFLLIQILLPYIQNSVLIDVVIKRFHEKFIQISQGNYYDATTSRSGIAEYYINNFKNQNIIFILFGSLKPLFYYIDIWKTAAHNTFIDMLYSIGLVGLIAMMVFILSRSNYWYRKYRIENEPVYLNVLLIKIILVLYMTSLSMFSIPIWQIILFL